LDRASRWHRALISLSSRLYVSSCRSRSLRGLRI
jgi:hypothetical protein